MIVQAIHYTFAREDADRVNEIFTELQQLSRTEPGIVQFDVARSKDQPNVFVLWEVYRDEAALQTHKDSEHFKRLALDGVRPLAKERIAETAIPLE